MIKVLIQADSRYPVNRKFLRALVNDFLIKEGFVSAVTVSVAIVGKRKMAQLHNDYMQLKGPTDVLSFPYTDPISNPKMRGKRFIEPLEEGVTLGDIVVCFPFVMAQAKVKNCLVDEEMKFLVEHGLAHLMGRHHE